MSGFIEIICQDNHKRLLNVKHIEEVVENIDKETCTIYMAFNVPNATEQDYFEVKESYNSICDKISEAVVLNAYAQVQNY